MKTRLIHNTWFVAVLMLLAFCILVGGPSAVYYSYLKNKDKKVTADSSNASQKLTPESTTLNSNANTQTKTTPSNSTSSTSNSQSQLNALQAKIDEIKRCKDVVNKYYSQYSSQVATYTAEVDKIHDYVSKTNQVSTYQGDLMDYNAELDYNNKINAAWQNYLSSVKSNNCVLPTYISSIPPYNYPLNNPANNNY